MAFFAIRLLFAELSVIYIGLLVYDGQGSEGQVRLTRFEKAGHPVPVPLTPSLVIFQVVVNILGTAGSGPRHSRCRRVDFPLLPSRLGKDYKRAYIFALAVPSVRLRGCLHIPYWCCFVVRGLLRWLSELWRMVLL